MDLLRTHWRSLLAALLALLAGGAVVVAVDLDGDGEPDQTTTITVPGLSPEQRAAERVEEGEPRNEPGDTDAVAKAFAREDARVRPFAGCQTRILPVNFSSRSGTRPVWLTWHYAVIRNTPGTSDLDLLFRIFANDARDASSHFGLDAEGNCIYMVPVEAKAWTAVNANPFSVSVEIIAFGDERELCPAACLAKAKSIARQVKARLGIPIRRGSVSSFNLCIPGRSGHIHHHDHRSCGGGHVDVTPFSIDSFVRRLATPDRTLTDKERKWVKSARKPKGTGHSRRFWCKLIVARIRLLAEPVEGRDRRARRNILRRVNRATCG